MSSAILSRPSRLAPIPRWRTAWVTRRRLPRPAACSAGSSRGARLRLRAIREEAERRREEREAEENPGELVTLPSGIQYRELDEGRADGKTAARSDTLYILYTVYRLAPGAYFKYVRGYPHLPVVARVRQRGPGRRRRHVQVRPRRLRRRSPEPWRPRWSGCARAGERARAGAAAARVDERRGEARAGFGAGRRLEDHKEERLLAGGTDEFERATRCPRRRTWRRIWNPRDGAGCSNCPRRRRRSGISSGRRRRFRFSAERRRRRVPSYSHIKSGEIIASPPPRSLRGDLVEHPQHAPHKLRHLAALKLNRLGKVPGQVPLRRRQSGWARRASSTPAGCRPCAPPSPRSSSCRPSSADRRLRVLLILLRLGGGELEAKPGGGVREPVHPRLLLLPNAAP